MDIKANLLSQAIWSYAPESVGLFSFYIEGTKLAVLFTKTKHTLKKLLHSAVKLNCFMNLDHGSQQLGVPLPYKETKSTQDADPLFVS